MLIALILIIPFASAPICYALGRKNPMSSCRAGVLVTALEFVLTLFLFQGDHSLSLPSLFPGGLSLQTDGFRAVYALVASFMWLCTSLFSLEYFRHEEKGLNRYILFVLITLGATEGVMLSSNYMATFLFFEILSFSSFTWVIHEETPGAVRAGYTYLFIAIIGGLVLFMGLILLVSDTGTLDYGELHQILQASPPGGRTLAAGICILLGFGAKAGMFPLHIWLPEAHPVAPSPASALLSGILTKVGIYGILMTALYPLAACPVFGAVIAVLGVITMALGALLALFSCNLKRTLACSSMSQIGFILTGISMYELLLSRGESEAAFMTLSGAMLHMLNHSIIKLVLFLASGVVVMNLHRLNLNDIWGYGRKGKPLFKLSFAIAALGISGVPAFNGYLSKTLLHEGLVEAAEVWGNYSLILKGAEWIFLISGGITFAYMLKLFICIFVERNSSQERQASFDSAPSYMNRISGTVIGLPALLVFILGTPFAAKTIGAYMSGSPAIGEFSPFTWNNLKGGLISLTIGGLIYLLIVRGLFMKGTQSTGKGGSVYCTGLSDALPPSLSGLARRFEGQKLLSYCGQFLFIIGVSLAKFLDRITHLTFLLTIASAFTKFICILPDAIIVLLRTTAVRERPVMGEKRNRTDHMKALLKDNTEAFRPVLMNFSFALMMTCVGILLILGALLILL
ncbi:MAG: complex I subunit 5 family protein [Lachnospiraceae bacterium]|nr:complex I subunit 5 family protein [Lachnospiraceae bacterium]